MLNQRLMMGNTPGGILYDRGDLHSDLTGGWEQNLNAIDQGPGLPETKLQKLTLAADCMQHTGNTPSNCYFVNYRCTGLVDLTGYRTLHVEYARSGYNANRLVVCMSASYNTEWGKGSSVSLEHTNGSISTASLDVSSLSGKLYISVGYKTNVNTSLTVNFYVYKVWLE